MKKTPHNKTIYRSMKEFRDRFLPESSDIRLLRTPEEARDFGANMARESLHKVKFEFARTGR